MQEEVIDLREIFGVLLKKLWIIILSAIVAAGAFFSYTYFIIKPTYQSSVLMYVNNSNVNIGSASFSISSSDLTAAQKLVETYVVILESRKVLNEVIKEAGVPYTYEEMKDMVTASAVNNTEVFRVTVTSTSPQEAENIANKIASILPTKIADIVNGSEVRIVDYGIVPDKKSAPSYTKNTAIGALAGAFVAAFIIVVIHLFDEVIRSEDYLTSTYPDIPLLAVVPDMNSSSSNKYGYYAYKKPSGGDSDGK